MNDLIKHISDNYSLSDINNLKKLLTEVENDKKELLNQSPTLYNFFNEYQEYVANTFSQKYLESVKTTFKHLLVFFGNEKNLTTIRVKDAEDFKSYIIKCSPKGYPTYLKTIRAGFNIALSWQFIQSNPFSAIKIKKPQQTTPDFLTKDELELVLAHTPNKIMKDIFLFGFHSGARLSEIINLKWQNVNLEERVISIGDKDFQTKNKKYRLVPLNKITFGLLVELSKRKINPNGNVFCKPDGFIYNKDFVSKSFKKAIRASGLRASLHFHSLRHSFGSNLSLEGVPLICVAELMGHSSVQTTERYTHTTSTALKQAVSKLEKLVA